MSPTIRIDAEVLEVLKEHAEPFVDTPNSVLRRILELPPRADATGAVGGGQARDQAPARAQHGRRSGAHRRRRRKDGQRVKAGTTLPDAAYQLPILGILSDAGGRSPTSEVIDALGERLSDRLGDADRERLASGDVRWRNRAQFARLNLIERGEMLRGSPRGVWEISEQGMARLKAEGDGGLEVPTVSDETESMERQLA